MSCERVYTAVDVQNLWKACREQFGEAARVDFQILGSLYRAICHPRQIEQRLVAYTVTTPKRNHHAFSQVLQSFGYQVKERFMRHQKGLAKPMHTDWDVGITVDALDQLDTYDTFALCSGDGDFALLLDYLKSKGKNTVVLTFEHATSRKLYETADQLHTFNRSIVCAGAP